jgi:hypothetical protein
MDKEGLTSEEITKMLEKKISNKEAMKAMKLKLSLMGDVNSPEELAKMVRESSSEFYSRGANWNGTVMVAAGVVVLVAVGLAAAMWWSATHECSAYESQPSCSTQTTCHGTVPNVSCRDEQVCFDTDVCTDYDYTGPHL